MPQFLEKDAFSVVRDGLKIHFFVENQCRWTVDPKLFDRDATVDFHRSGEVLYLSLKNAFFPGTQLPASFESTIQKSGTHWDFAMDMDVGLTFHVDFVPWLLGIIPTKSQWKVQRMEPFDGFALSLEQPVDAHFKPDWSLHINSRATAIVKRLDCPLDLDECRIGLDEGEPIAGGPVCHRTTFTVLRQQADWAIDLNRSSEAGWQLSHETNIFDVLKIECANSTEGPIRTALLHREARNFQELPLTEGSEPTLSFRPGGALCTDCGEPFVMTLRNARLAVSLEDAFHSSLLADLSEERSWAHDSDVSYLLGKTTEAPLFELHESPGAAPVPQVVPGLCEVCFPSDDSCIGLKLGVPRPIPFTWGDVFAPFERFWGWLHLLPSQHGKGLLIDLQRGDTLIVERPNDMVSLKFGFENMRLVTGIRPRIVHAKGKSDPRVLVEFPPQHIAEKAYFHTSLSGFGDDPPVGLIELAEYNNADTSSPITLPALKQKLDPDSVNPKYDTDDAKPPITIANKSQLVFGLPTYKSEILCNTEALLDWSSWDPIVAPVAQSTVNITDSSNLPSIVDPAPPDPNGTQYTSIELPWRLNLSPSERGRWAHSIKPVESASKIVELWHTRLGVVPETRAASSAPRQNPQKVEACPDVVEAPTSGKAMPVDETNQKDRTIRAIWTFGFVPPPAAQLSCSTLTPDKTWPPFPEHFPTDNDTNADPFRMSLDARDRTELVHLMSNYAITQQTYFCQGGLAVPYDPTHLLTPAPAQVRLLMLTAMGGYLEALGQWNPGKVDQNHQLTVQLWEHSATLGRDHYAKVMYKGFLMPFGLSASLVKVTQRVFTQVNDGSYVAILHQFMYIVVKDEQKPCPIPGQPFNGRAFPFTFVEPVTLQTPNLNDPSTQPWSQKPPGAPMQSQSLFWPMVRGDAGLQIFNFGVRFSDANGAHILEASMPLVFVGSDVAQMDGFGDSTNGWKSQDAVRLYNGGSAAYFGTATDPDDPWMNASFGGNKISFAKTVTPGDTDFDTSSINWRAQGLMAQVDVTLSGIVLQGAADYVVVSFTEAYSGTTFVQNMPSSMSAVISLNSGNYAVTVSSTIGGKVAHVTSPAFQFDGNQQYTLALPLNSDGSQFSTAPTQTNLNTAGMMSVTDLYRSDLPYFYPTVDSANITSSSIKRITGVASATKFVFYSGYLANGFDTAGNPGEVLLQKHPSDSLTLAFGASGQVDKAGGLASPDTLVVGFSRKTGVVGGKMANAIASGTGQTVPSVDAFSGGKFDAADFFGGLSSAKLLGAVKLSDIIAAIAPGLVSNLGKAPAMIEQSIYNVDSAVIAFATEISSFQGLQGNPLATQLSAQAQQVATASAAAQSALASGDIVAEGIAGAQLVARIADYAAALKSALQSPAAIVEQEILGLLTQALMSILASAARPTISAALTSAGQQLTQTLEIGLSTLDAQLQLLSKEFQDKSKVVMDELTGKPQPLTVLAPEISHLLSVEKQVAALKGTVKTLGDSIQAAAQAINAPAGQQPSMQQLPQSVSSLATVLANIRQVFEKAGLLIDVAVNFKQQKGTAFTDLLTTLKDQMLTYWSAPYIASAAALATVAKNLATLEDNCIILTSAWDQTIGQQILQSLRQLQKSVSQAQAFYAKQFTGTTPDAKLTNGYRQLQALQKMQGQMLRALAELQTLAIKTLPANASAAVQQASNDIQAALPSLASSLTVAQTLLGTGANQAIENIVATFVSDTLLAGPLAAPCADLQNQLTGLRTRINQNATDLGLLLLHYNLSIDYQRPLAAALAYVNYLTAFALDTQSAVIGNILTLASNFQAAICTLRAIWATFRANLKQLDGPDITTSSQGLPLGAVVDSLFKSDFDAIDNAFTVLCDPNQKSPSQMLRNVQSVAATFVALESDVRTKITSIPAVVAALTDEIKQQAQVLIEDLLSGVPIPTSVNLSYTWQPDIQSCEPVFLVDPGASFSITASAQGGLNSQLNGLQASFNIQAELTNFEICLIGDDPFITLVFESLTFTSQNGSKVDCRAHLDRVHFGGDMQFVEELAEILDPTDGPFIELAADSIRAGFRFAISSLTMGAFNLMQLAIEVAVALPFDGTPVRCEFGLSDQQQPFLLSSGIFGGGGFLQLQLGLDGVQLLQGALEFGVCAAISIGPLSGEGFVMAGIYFRVTATKSEVCGFVHAHGHMDIFGIITLDVDLYVAICYQDPSVQGIATFSVSVSIAFFSETFSMQAKYSYQGSSDASASPQVQSLSTQVAMQGMPGPNTTQKRTKSICPDHWQAPLFISPAVWKTYYDSFAK